MSAYRPKEAEATRAAEWLGHLSDFRVVASEREGKPFRGLYWEFEDFRDDDCGWIGDGELIEIAKERGWKEAKA